MNILIIESSPEFRADIRQMLTYASGGSYRFQEAENGDLGLRMSRAMDVTIPHCVLLSCDLPDMTAQKVILGMRGDAELSSSPIVVVGSDKNADGRAYLRDGAQDYVGKRVLTSSSLMLAVENAVERFRLICENKRTFQKLQESEARLSVLLHEAENRRLELEAIMEAVPAQVWIARDPECRRIFGNRDVYEFLGCDRTQNVSMSAPLEEKPANFETYRHGAVVPLDELPMQYAARTGRAVRGVDLELRFSDGRSKWIYGNAEPLRDASGNLCGAIAGMVDFTEQKRAYDQLQESEQRLRALFESSARFMMLLSLDGKVLEGNAVAIHRAGVARSELVGRPWSPVSGQQVLGRTAPDWEDALGNAARGKVTSIEFVLAETEKHTKMQFQLKPLRDGKGSLDCILLEGEEVG